MSVVTLTSDLGTGSHYVAILKASLLGRDASLNIIDITHEIQPFNLIETAFVTGNSWKHFARGTVHILAVDTATSEYKKHLIAVKDGQYFIAADNGVLSLIFSDSDPEIYKIKDEYISKDLFEANHIYTVVAAELVKGKKIEDLGEKEGGYSRLTPLHPVVRETTIVGTVIYVDRFQNVFTNITKEIFENFVGKERFEINLSRHERIHRISNSYSDVGPGEKLALFGDNQLLQIAINKGGLRNGAAQLMGLSVGKQLLVEKDDRKNSKNAI